tara:strand:- start:2184 stop:3143 length:960 start_codon:yes stop_codon:yes gene_type:complete
MSEDNVAESIKKSRPNISDNSVKLYERNLKKLQSMFDTDDYKFLKDIDKVKEKLDHLSSNTQRNYFNAIIIYLMAIDSDKDLIKEYGDIRDELNQKYEDDNATGKISDKQKDNFVDIKEIHKMLDEMADEIKGKKIKKKEDLKPKEKALLQVYTIFNIYTRLPMRNDVSGMEAISKREYNKLKEDEKKEKNYLVINKNNMFMVLNKYKTSKKYEENKIDVPKDLEKLLRVWIRINGMGVLFTTSTGNALSRNALSQLLIKTTKKYMGKSISTTMLRKIYLSSKYGDVQKEMEKDAKVMGHSKEVAQNIYIKEGQEDSEE